MATRKPRTVEFCICKEIVTDDNWREHYTHWVEATAQQLLAQGKKIDEVGTEFRPAMTRILADRSYYRTGIYPPAPRPAPTQAWTARTENTLGQLLCRLAEGEELGGTCGAHIGEARVILNHLADLGVLKTPPGETT